MKKSQGREQPRAVLDTNVVVAGVINAGGPPGRLLDAVSRGVLQPVISRLILAEYVEVLSRQRFGFEPVVVEHVCYTLASLALIVTPRTNKFHGMPDPDDAIFMNAARHAKCPVITGNTRHFPPECGLDVLTPASALRWLSSQASPGR